MKQIILDPSGSGRIGDFYSGANGNTTAHMEKCGERIVVHVNGDKLVAYPEQFVDTNGDPIGSAEDVLEYIQANFNKAPVTQGQMEAYVNSRIQNISQEDYDALDEEEQDNGTLYLIPVE